ncbi:PaaI family thioesterase [Nocardia sp. NPDC050717]|uniref:PaaI family thioesterase n=1 Tax=Nocardia sp. NPDC050717 TaxID=3157221 RepID=UPI0033D354F3
MTVIELDTARRVLAAQPFNEVVGARLAAFGDGQAVLELDITDRHRQQFGLVHGGVLAYCADNALTFAAGTVLGASILTTEVTVKYLHAARHGTLRTTAVVDHKDRRQALCSARIEVVDADGTVTVCALATGTARLAEPKTSA